eukprot:3060200-Ditylum_brightwellii.AAC.1
MRKDQRKQKRRKTCIGRQGKHIAAKRFEQEERHTANILQDRFSVLALALVHDNCFIVNVGEIGYGGR